VLGVNEIEVDIETMLQLVSPKALVGKPKLFFIQACRGSGYDTGNTFADSIREWTDAHDGQANGNRAEPDPSW
jgi:hypothetical protein